MNLLVCTTSLFVLLLFATAYANTEKVIFTAPAAFSLADSGPNFEQLRLQSITPQTPSLRLSLPVAFPTEEQPHGLDAWYLLGSFTSNQRYELRVCWAAIRPTTFRLDVYNISHVFDTPHLIQSLASYSETRQHQDSPKATLHDRKNIEHQESLLFLHVQAAADFFTSNKTLMRDPPPVDIDIILDPYLANVFPRSLVPTAVYIVTLAIGAWIVSGVIWKRLFSATDKSHND